MPQLENRQFLDFEKPIKDLYDQIEQFKQAQEKSKLISLPPQKRDWFLRIWIGSSVG